MEEFKNTIGQRMRAARKAKGLTQKEVGEKIGVTESSYNIYESGKQNLTLETVKKIADALEIEVYTLFK